MLDRRLTVLFVVGALLSARYGWLFLEEVGAAAAAAPGPSAAGWLALGALLQVAALTLRAYKWTLLTRGLRPGDFGGHLRALSVGCVFNAFFPLRLGELLRAHLLGRELRVSRVAVLCTIVFERALDGLFLASFFAAFAAAGTPHMRPGALAGPVAVLFAVSTAMMVLLALLYSGDRSLLKAVDTAARLFNDRIRDGLRLAGWSAIHGTHLFLATAPMARYLAATAAMWGCYLGSMAAARVAAAGAPGPGDLAAALASLIAVGIPSGPGSLGIYHYLTVAALPEGAPGAAVYSVWSWAVAVVPVTLMGLAALVGSRELRDTALLRRRGAGSGPGPASGIDRAEQPSADFLAFLETYFAGLELSQVVGRSEIAGDVRLVKMLRGGSNALSLLVRAPEGERVRKVCLRPYGAKLRHQYEWLRARQDRGIFPKTLGLGSDERTVYYDMEYYPSYSSLYSFIHSTDLPRAKALVTRIVDAAAREIHGEARPGDARAELQRYIKEKVLDKVNDCLIYDPALGPLLRAERVVVNGTPYDNLSTVLPAITNDGPLMAALASARRCELHGDLTVDNILTDGERFLLLDPNDENLVPDPLVDWAKLGQSFDAGYEYLVRLPRAEAEGPAVRFDEETSSRYTELHAHLRALLEEREGPERLRLLRFHEAVHFARMLPYRLRLNRASFPAFYAVMVRLFNQFRAEASGG